MAELCVKADLEHCTMALANKPEQLPHKHQSC
jgi:hypothetical protein